MNIPEIVKHGVQFSIAFFSSGEVKLMVDTQVEKIVHMPIFVTFLL